MNFVGPARPLSGEDVTLIAGYLGCHVAAVRAVLAVESAGKGFGPDGRPIILNEPHIFYRELGAGATRDRAVKGGLAYAKWGDKPYPKTQAARYEWLAKAMAFNETAALKSCSWGLGQVMGFNHKVAGFDTVQAFVRAMTVSEGAQLYAMARFIVSNNLQRHMRSLDWTAFAKGYNGAGYAKNQYHTKLASAYKARPASEKATPPATTAEQLAVLAGQAEPKPPIPDIPAPARPVEPRPLPDAPKPVPIPPSPSVPGAGGRAAAIIAALAAIGAIVWAAFFN
jgi:hypothetical protein